ncbi:TIGR03915 family putative DNA repair protein [Aridibaculum aurantiacum]|uniref:TIGR03915 family putative DNA repair protein n=1 Tax=Aridibaculum aurantiacum TaxID=2810307 RepID=UPI001A969FE8|nr:TIGR03915 family putative DNA repair protein [Aridibaculum aurantiacum]
MVTMLYDGSFEGWLTAVFEVYEYKYAAVQIVTSEQHQPNVFATIKNVVTDEAKAERVWKGLKQKISANAVAQVYKTFLGEEIGVENKLLEYVQYAFSRPQSIESDFAHSAVLYVWQMAKKVHREKHRMEAFIRFQKMKDNLYYAVCQPDYNVLPLIERHFKDRYADQQWLLYDTRRKYGLYYDLQNVSVVEMHFSEESNEGKELQHAFDEHEALYQVLWKQYFDSVNIAARKNTKLHIQHMPKRYWKYLPEKRQL